MAFVCLIVFSRISLIKISYRHIVDKPKLDYREHRVDQVVLQLMDYSSIGINYLCHQIEIQYTDEQDQLTRIE